MGLFDRPKNEKEILCGFLPYHNKWITVYQKPDGSYVREWDDLFCESRRRLYPDTDMSVNLTIKSKGVSDEEYQKALKACQ